MGERVKLRTGWLRWVGGLVVGLLVFTLLVFFSLPWLLIASPDKPQPADVILHTAIDARSKADDYVVDLYRQGLGREVVCVSSQISWELYPGDFTRANLIEKGLPAESVSSLHMPITDCTAQGARVLAEHGQSKGWKRVLVVGHPDGSRFSWRVVRREFAKRGIEATLVYAPADERELRDGWWRTHWKVQRMVSAAMETTMNLLYPECR